MKRFRIEFTDEAKADITKSYYWGKQEWGPAKAERWYRALRSSVRELLTNFPFGQPVAPESVEFGFEIRQLIFQRYRLLYEVKGKTVRILHLKGPFVVKNDRSNGESE